MTKNEGVIFSIFSVFFIFNRSWFSQKNWGWQSDTPKLKVKLSETEREMVRQRKLKRDELFEIDKSAEEKFMIKGTEIENFYFYLSKIFTKIVSEKCVIVNA